MMRTMQRALRRAEIPLSYSQGFNPHQKLSISNPLPIGVTGSEDFLEIQVNTQPDYDKIVESMNQALPKDIRVLWAAEPKGSLNEIKNIANHLADTLMRDEDEFDREYDKIKDLVYISYISILAQLYYNIKTGVLSRDDGLKIQEELFLKVDYMRRNENV